MGILETSILEALGVMTALGGQGDSSKAPLLTTVDPGGYIAQGLDLWTSSSECRCKDQELREKQPQLLKELWVKLFHMRMNSLPCS